MAAFFIMITAMRTSQYATISFSDAAFAGAQTKCKFKVKNSTGERIRVCEYDNDDIYTDIDFHDKALSDGSWAWFNCDTSTCEIRVQWYRKLGIDLGSDPNITDTYNDGYHKLLTSRDVDVQRHLDDRR